MPRTPLCLVATLSCALAATAHAQAFNIDLDFPGATPPLGEGAPSAAFGAASGQVGVWNSVSFGGGPFALVDLAGGVTAATMSIVGSTSLLGFNNATNSGDYRLLMNDARQVGTVVQGGTATFTINNIANGSYQVWTYAAPPQGTPGSTNVTINSVSMFATGGASGNAFSLGGTHVVHNVLVTGNSLSIIVNDPTGDGLPAYINGFQIVVPAPGAAVAFLGLAPIALRRKR